MRSLLRPLFSYTTSGDSQWDGMAPHSEAKFGARFRGRETEWEHISSDLATVQALLADWARQRCYTS